MADDTRKLLRVFGVAVTDFEAEATRLTELAGRLDGASADEARALVRDAARALVEVQARWLEVTTHLAGLTERLLTGLAGAPPQQRGGGRRTGE